MQAPRLLKYNKTPCTDSHCNSCKGLAKGYGFHQTPPTKKQQAAYDALRKKWEEYLQAREAAKQDRIAKGLKYAECLQEHANLAHEEGYTSFEYEVRTTATAKLYTAQQEYYAAKLKYRMMKKMEAKQPKPLFSSADLETIFDKLDTVLNNFKNYKFY